MTHCKRLRVAATTTASENLGLSNDKSKVTSRDGSISGRFISKAIIWDDSFSSSLTGPEDKSGVPASSSDGSNGGSVIIFSKIA
jgi:hypothetical protein